MSDGMHAAGPHCCDCDAVKYGYIHCCADHDPSRAILTDLIAELRAEHAREEVVICDGCPDTYDAGESCPRLRAADRAEQRLWEVQGE